MDNNLLHILTTSFSTWWWLILGLFFLLYIVLDGADLGAGIFAIFSHDEEERGAIMASMAGFWDGNETWLVVAGGVIFGAFPIVYGSAFSYLMIPLMIALWAIISRAVAFEFHIHARTSKRFWGWAFALGSLLAPFFAGVSLGATLQGFPLKSGLAATITNSANYHSPLLHYAGGALDFLSPFSLWVGVAAVIAASLAGGLYLCARFVPGDPIHERAKRWTSVTLYVALAAIVVTLLWSYALFPWAAAKWTGRYWFIWIAWLLIVLGFAFKTMSNHGKQHDIAALLWGGGMVAQLWIALWASLYPWVVPNTWTIHAAANPANSMAVFTMFMTGFVPVMVMYNWYQIWVFRGRLTKKAAYGGH